MRCKPVHGTSWSPQAGTLPLDIASDTAGRQYRGLDPYNLMVADSGIYFSHSGKNTSIITPDLTIRRTSTEEYRQYELNFRYLESQLGRQQLLVNISNSTLQVDESLLFKYLGIESADELSQHAIEWQAGMIRNRIWIVLVLALLVGWGMYRMLPEERCECGYQGRRSDFVDGRCPECGRIHQLNP